MKKTDRGIPVEGGHAGALSQLGIETEDSSIKVLLAKELNGLIDELAWTQDRLARELGIPQPHVSDLRRYKLRRFSSDRLIMFLRALNQDVLITVRSAKSPAAVGDVRVKRAA